jgi:cell division protein FtsI (penicillin-binding protein 3)/stage V sporulation protein D (sporulation-specific penicillin-binding protein)
LDLDLKTISEKIKSQNSKESFFVLLKDELTEREIKEIRKLKSAGIYLRKKDIRIYPQKEFASHIIGFLGGEGIGQYGLEGYYDRKLRGKTGFIIKEKNPWNFNLGIIHNKTYPGATLILTVDYNVQQEAERLLKKAKEELKIEEGQIIVADPNTGKILALAHYPFFDPNQYSKVEDIRIFQNGALQKIFEPGSVFKPIVIASALEENEITPETFYNDQGFVKIGGYTIYNYNQRKFGRQTMKQVLEKSINTGAVFVQRKIGKKYLDYLEKFGFFEPTGIDLQGEIYSKNKHLKIGREINLATASFGQGVEITAFQLLRAFSAIANGGKLIKPYIVERIIEPEDKEIIIEPQIQRENLLSSQILNQIISMLINVVEKGSAKKTKISGYYIAGKTGTAQVPFTALGLKKSGYSKEHTIQSFIGFFPAWHPQFIILVKLHNPTTKTAEYSAVPIFRELAKYIINYWPVLPDY